MDICIVWLLVDEFVGVINDDSNWYGNWNVICFVDQGKWIDELNIYGQL